VLERVPLFLGGLFHEEIFFSLRPLFRLSRTTGIGKEMSSLGPKDCRPVLNTVVRIADLLIVV